MIEHDAIYITYNIITLCSPVCRAFRCYNNMATHTNTQLTIVYKKYYLTIFFGLDPL